MKTGKAVIASAGGVGARATVGGRLGGGSATMLWRIGAKSGREISEADVTVLLSLQKYCQVVFDRVAIDNASTQYYCCVIIPKFDADGLLPPGVHWANWDELTDRLGNNPWRQHLMTGLRAALENLKGCWMPDRLSQWELRDEQGLTKRLRRLLGRGWGRTGGSRPRSLDLRSRQGHAEGQVHGGLFPASIIAGADGLSFLELFQTDKDTGRSKGIIAIDLGGFA